jgi:hypothetical protein
MRDIVLALLMVLGLSFAWTSPTLAEKRVALVIGNDNYSALPDLNNARKDATDMAAKLKGLGFEVILKINARRRDMGRALAEFEGKLSSSQTGLVFYAGHGIQADGRNYLIPSDARIEVEEDLRYEGVDAKDILEAMGRSGASMNIVILDACRDNPLPKRTRSAARGLSVVGIPKGTKGTAVLYSAGEGQTAQDGQLGGNGVFTGELLKVLDQPGLTLEQVFKRVAKGVGDLTHGKQRPWSLTSLQGDFYFRPVQAATSPSLGGGMTAEMLFWQSIQGSKNPADFEAYVLQFPNGTFAALARNRIKDLKGRQVASLPPPKHSFDVSPMDEELVAVKNANVRSEPSTRGDKVGRFSAGSKVNVTGKTRVSGSTWYRVALARGNIGYVLGNLLKDKPPVAAKPNVTPVVRIAREAAAIARGVARKAKEAARLAREAAARARQNPGQGFIVGDSSAGEHYEGEYRDDKRIGHGVNIWASGNHYEGEYRDNKRNGRGVYTWASGNRYEGEYRDDIRNGRGVFTWASGNRYEGEYRDDKRNGRGVYTYADGRVKDGTWKNGKLVKR